MLHALDTWITHAGPWALWLLGAAAIVEYLFPPFPGDTIALLGGVYAARGQKPWPLVLLFVMAGSVLGAAINYGAGRLLAGQLENPRGKSFLGLSPERVQSLRERMQRQGSWLIVINRFLPGVRSLVFVAAGAARMRVDRVLIAGALSALAYNTLLILTGMVVGGNAERLELFVHRWQIGASVLICAGAFALLARWLFVRRRRALEVE
jgi:membrane protein DedA with SNARE-associated domain